MVSALWKACQDGDLPRVQELLVDASSVDIEIKDHTGVTPLIQAVRGGHVQIVKILLDKGADPTNASAQGRPETYSTDPHILHLLAASRGEPVMSFPDPSHYYPYPYAQYPGYPDPAAAWYPPPPPPPPPAPQVPQGAQEGEHAANLPPPEVARNIPCRYYPACRYGSACVFAHPQVPYFPGPLPPPAQYVPPPASAPPPGPQHYDPAMPPYPYYPVSPPFNPPPPHPHAHPNPHPHSASPPAPPGHIRTHSEVVSPPPFSPSHLPVPVPVPVQYLPPPMSPSYPPPNQPGPMSPSYPPPNPNHVYPRRASVTSLASYPSPVALDPPHGGPPLPKIIDGQQPANGAPGSGGHAGGNGNGRQRRGSAGFRSDKPQYGGRKPPCLFFPSGRCRNGDDCRFPHVMPEGGTPSLNQHSRGQYPPRSRAGYYGSRDSVGSGFSNLEERLAGLTTKTSNASNGPSSDAKSNDGAGSGLGGTSTPSRTGTKSHTRNHNHSHNHNHNHNHNRERDQHHMQPQPQPQRVPSADEFPVLQANGHGPGHGVNGPGHGVNGHHHSSGGTGAGGAGTGMNGLLSHAHTNGWVNAVNGTGPTAAQLLREKDAAVSRAASSRGSSPRLGKETKSQAAGVTTSTQNASSTNSTGGPPTAAPAPENLASSNKSAAEVQVSA